MNASNAAGVQLIDISTGRWSHELCALAGIEPDRLSPLQPTGTMIGKITAETSGTTGLSTETLVINGGHDQVCSALGLGITGSGRALLAGGTAWVLTTAFDKPAVNTVPNSVKNVSKITLSNRIGDTAAPSSAINTSTLNVSWLLTTLDP